MEIHTLINSKAITWILEVQMHKNNNHRRQTAVPAALRMDHAAALSSRTSLRFFFFFSPVDSNQIRSSYKHCSWENSVLCAQMYVYVYAFVFVSVCVVGGVSGGWDCLKLIPFATRPPLSRLLLAPRRLETGSRVYLTPTQIECDRCAIFPSFLPFTAHRNERGRAGSEKEDDW